MKILELFSGIGAISVVARELQHQVICAIDINDVAMQVYQANFDSPTRVREIASIPILQLGDFGADCWWMSPPCQPFTRRGLQKDLEDPRTKPLLHLIKAIEQVRPSQLALENVIGFESSKTFALLYKALTSVGYQISTAELCSSNFGLPNLRPRFFLAASKTMKPNLDTIPNGQSRFPKRKADQVEQGEAAVCIARNQKPIADFLDTPEQLVRWSDDLSMNASIMDEYPRALNIVKPGENLTACFTSAYGRSMVRSGSYLETGTGIRRFSPSEHVRLLGFPDSYWLPENLSTSQLWRLIGNSVSIECARHELQSFEQA